jgi:hypothetical protein
MQGRGSKFKHAFDIIPETFVLPRQYAAFLTAFNHTAATTDAPNLWFNLFCFSSSSFSHFEFSLKFRTPLNSQLRSPETMHVICDA